MSFSYLLSSYLLPPFSSLLTWGGPRPCDRRPLPHSASCLLELEPRGDLHLPCVARAVLRQQFVLFVMLNIDECLVRIAADADVVPDRQGLSKRAVAIDIAVRKPESQRSES